MKTEALVPIIVSCFLDTRGIITLFRAHYHGSNLSTITRLLGVLRKVLNLSVHSLLICKTGENFVLLLVLAVPLLLSLFPYQIHILKEIPYIVKMYFSNRFV